MTSNSMLHEQHQEPGLSQRGGSINRDNSHQHNDDTHTHMYSSTCEEFQPLYAQRQSVRILEATHLQALLTASGRRRLLRRQVKGGVWVGCVSSISSNGRFPFSFPLKPQRNTTHAAVCSRGIRGEAVTLPEASTAGSPLTARSNSTASGA